MRRLMYLWLFCSLLFEISLAQESHFQTIITTNNSLFDVDLSGLPSTSGSTLSIVNKGGSMIAVPSVAATTSMPPLNRQAIVNFLLLRRTSNSDESFAIAGWQYMLDHSVGFCSAGTSSDPQGSASDPMHILNGYGFGCCGQVANILAWLWAGVGYPVRVAVFTFHTVPEIYYGGAWHLLDPDHRVFYRNLDGSIASVAQVLADPSLVANTHDANGLDPVGWPAVEMAELYASNAPSLVDKPFAITGPVDPSFTLYPRETLRLQNRDPWPQQLYDAAGALAPDPEWMASATFLRDVDFTNNGWKSQAVSWQGVRTAVQGDGRQAVVSTNDGTILFQKSTPFPILAMQVTGEFAGNTTSGLVSVSFSKDGVTWSPPLPFPASDFTGHASVDLTQVAQGAYSYYLQIQIIGPSIGIYQLPIRVDAQAGAAMFPALVPGQINALEYHDLSPANQPRNLEVTLSIPHGKSSFTNLTAYSQIPESPTYSIARNYLAQNLVDGDSSTLAYPGSNQLDDIVSLGTPRNVNQVSIWWGYFGTSAIYVNRWSLYGRSGQNSPWQLLANGFFPNAAISDIPINGANLTDVRVTATSVNWIGIYELQVYGDEIGPALAGANVTVQSQVRENPIYCIAAGYIASNLVDGNLNTLSYPASTNIDYVVHLNTPSHVSNAAVQWGYFGANPIYINNWSLSSRIGQGDWTPIGSGGFPDSNSTNVQADIVATDLQLTASSSLNWIGAYELAISASAPVQPVQVTSNAPYRDPTYLLSNLTDGNDQTLAYPDQVFNDYELDFGADTYIDFVNINWGYFGTNSIYVQSWGVYGQRDGEYDWTPLAIGDFPNAAQTRANIRSTIRRLRVTSASPSNWIGIYEITAYGSNWSHPAKYGMRDNQQPH